MNNEIQNFFDSIPIIISKIASEGTELPSNYPQLIPKEIVIMVKKKTCHVALVIYQAA